MRFFWWVYTAEKYIRVTDLRLLRYSWSNHGRLIIISNDRGSLSFLGEGHWISGIQGQLIRWGEQVVFVSDLGESGVFSSELRGPFNFEGSTQFLAIPRGGYWFCTKALLKTRIEIGLNSDSSSSRSITCTPRYEMFVKLLLGVRKMDRTLEHIEL